jgi:hypothetical protein
VISGWVQGPKIAWSNAQFVKKNKCCTSFLLEMEEIPETFPDLRAKIEVLLSYENNVPKYEAERGKLKTNL